MVVNVGRNGSTFTEVELQMMTTAAESVIDLNQNVTQDSNDF
jgi:hypothetical protein